jgi:hypothetical protein
MLLNQTDTREYDGNLQGETIAVGIKDVRLIIDRLTDMYSDREMAVLREYSCNALDAHIEAGITSPIEVSTPGPLAPFLTIRDFGVGLCLEDIREIYSQYGASTKRNTNTQTGAFGLGCKSGLAYSDQFTVTSTKDGVRIQVVVSRDPSAGITMKVVDTSDTSDPNGTTIMIPARSMNNFERKAKELFQYWPKGTVKLNGYLPEYMPGVKWVSDSICINESQGYGSRQSVIVMGGVPYPAEINHGLGYGKSITAFVPIGSCEPAPPRESLIDSDSTTKTIAQVERDFRAGLSNAIIKDVQNASTTLEAARKKREWYGKVGSNNMPYVQYKGQDVPDSYEIEADVLLLAPLFGRKMNAHNTYRKSNHIPLPTLNGSVWVTGFDYVSYTATVRKKLDKWVEAQALSAPPTNYVLTATDQKPDQTWLEGITFVDWATIKAIKLPKNIRSTTSGRIPGSYDLYESGDLNEDVPADDIDTTHDLFWMVGKPYYGRKAAAYLNKSYPGCTLVMMREGRQEKFQRLFPKAKSATRTIEADFDKWVAGIDKKDALAIHMRQSGDRRLNDIDVSQVNDPEVALAKSVIDRDTTALDMQIKEWSQLGFYYAPDDEDGDLSGPMDKYPLLPDSYCFARYMRTRADHVYRYMNAEYAYLKEQS